MDVEPPLRARSPYQVQRDIPFIVALLAAMGWMCLLLALVTLGGLPRGSPVRAVAALPLPGLVLLPASWCGGFVLFVRYLQRRRRPEIDAYPEPMHRHPALRPLSRGHQPILMHARDLRYRAAYLERGDGHLLPDAFAAFRTYAEEQLERHLGAEEIHLLPRVEEIVDDDLRAALVADREARDALRTATAEVTEETLDGLRRLGDALENHARGCERGLFPIVERVLDDEVLAAFLVDVDAYQV